MSGDGSIAVVRCPCVGFPVFAICIPLWTHYSAVHSPTIPLGRSGFHITLREFVSTPTNSGPAAPAKQFGAELRTHAFMVKYTVITVNTTQSEVTSIDFTHPWSSHDRSYTLPHQNRDSSPHVRRSSFQSHVSACTDPKRNVLR
ncbi:hypothetical protein, unlikely [Trypanosoma congolense IL3000]|uniref:Uncharacterized protein n=1 Tax=Trypanosoma congolense (strain IL3000) TaxID=1068625 RepID=F9W5F6_TRYCI|nr:hypothetical protein, unlikely [Trypanosoma congolense IL3000]